MGRRRAFGAVEFLQHGVAFAEREFFGGEGLAETLGGGDLFDGFEVLDRINLC